MPKRPPVLLACVLFGLLGLLIGLEDFRGLATFLAARHGELFPRPRSVTWVAGLRGPAAFLEAASLPLRALIIGLLVTCLGLLGRLLCPRFHLLKAGSEAGPGGMGVHVDLSGVLRAAAGVALSLWLIGAFAPLAFLGAGRGAALGYLLLGGLPVWTAALPGPAAPLLLSLLLGVLLWAIWGPNGVACTEGDNSRREVLLWGMLAGLAAMPAVTALYAGRMWLAGAATAVSLTDRSGWTLLLALTFAVPILAAVLLGAIAALFRPRPVSSAAVRAAALTGALLALLGVAEVYQAQGTLERLDVGKPGLARLFRLPPSPLRRFALILTPDGRSAYTVARDDVDDGMGGERMVCNATTTSVLDQFLQRRRYRSALAFQAYSYLYGCASLSWQITERLRLSLEALEGAASPVAAEKLLDTLAQCPTTPEHRKILDAIADSTRFQWDEPQGRRWLGAAYVRFGDMARAREYLLTSDLNEAQLRTLLAGLPPLAQGVVRGRMTVRGKVEAGVRLGLVTTDREAWRELVGPSDALEWERVGAVAHTDAQGRFEFRDIPEGRYVLLITGGGLGRHSGLPTPTAHPRVIVLDNFHPVQELPKFDLRFTRPLNVPSDLPPGVTARRSPEWWQGHPKG